VIRGPGTMEETKAVDAWISVQDLTDNDNLDSWYGE